MNTIDTSNVELLTDRAVMAWSASLSLVVAAVHTGTALAAGDAVAFSVYRWLGLWLLSKAWFNLDVIWPLSLVLVGAIGVTSAL